MLKRLDTLDVATSDLSDAASIYAKNFGFAVEKSHDGESASVKVGGAEIKLIDADAASIAVDGEGMVGLWLEADDVELAVAALKRAGIEAGPVLQEAGRRIVAIDPKCANQVPLFIFDRKE